MRKPNLLPLFLVGIPFLILLAALFLCIRVRNVQEPAPGPDLSPEVTGTAGMQTCTPVPDSNVPETEPTDGTDAPEPDGILPEETLFTLSILRETVPVARGVSEETLERSPGWLETSSDPGQEGFCIIYGHRNRKHLKVLKDIDYGDSITVRMPSGREYVYTVESTEILDSESDLHIPAISGKHLLLMTCYPFYYTGHAPNKFVCTCVLTDTRYE